jgi:hypothetical protein
MELELQKRRDSLLSTVAELSAGLPLGQVFRHIRNPFFSENTLESIQPCFQWPQKILCLKVKLPEYLSMKQFLIPTQ